jgi:hypothetical protein
MRSELPFSSPDLPETDELQDRPEESLDRRGFLGLTFKWSKAVLAAVTAGAALIATEEEAQAHPSWANHIGGGGWFNRRGSGGGWGNGGGGGIWVNGGGGAWGNRGGAWGNRGGSWGNVIGGGGWANRGGSGGWVNRRGGGGTWGNRR